MGRPKYLLPLHGEPLLLRMCRIVGQVVRPIVVVAAVDQIMPPLPNDVYVVTDTMAASGPLAGIQRGLQFLHDSFPDVSAAFVTSCDAPLLRPEVVSLLCRQLSGYDAVAARQDELLHPLCAVWRTQLTIRAQQLLHEGERRPRRLLAEANTLAVDCDQLRSVDNDLSSLRNINTPADYELLLQTAKPEEKHSSD